MKNLEQLRAQRALDFWTRHCPPEVRQGSGAPIARQVAALVLNQGLLAAVAFAKAQSRERRSSAEELLLEVGRFLASPERGLLPFAVQGPDDLVRGLTNHPSTLLQQATLESIAYLGYLIRLAPRPKSADIHHSPVQPAAAKPGAQP